MKIHQLANGERFEYEGQIYVKTGPMSAAGEAGQRLIPRYAVLTPLREGVNTAAEKSQREFSKASVVGAFEVFFVQCQGWVLADKHSELAEAREQFLQSISS